MTLLVCNHVNYDDYFEKCSDCGATLAEIHHNECGEDFEVDDDDVCQRCGYEVVMYTNCDKCGWFGIPIIDGCATELCDVCCEDEDREYLDELQASLEPWERRSHRLEVAFGDAA